MPLFTDASDLEGIERVEDIKYIKQLRFMSRWIDGWAKRSNESLLYRYLIVVVLALSLVGGLIYLQNKVGIATAFDLGHQYISVFMIAVAVVRGAVVLLENYNKFILYFLNEIHLFHHKNRSSHAYRTHITIHKLCHLYTTCIMKIATGAFFLFNLRPIVNNFCAGMFTSNKSHNAIFETSLYYALPFDYESNLVNYIAISIFNCYISGSCLSYFIIIDTIISLMVFHLWGHIKILTNDLENFVNPLSKIELEGHNRHNLFVGCRFSEEEMKEILRKLELHIRHHNLIVNFLSRMSTTFGSVLLVHYAFLQVSGCLMLLMCSPMDSESFARYGPLTLYCFQQLIQSSIIFELLDSSNDALTDAIYGLPWECMNTKCMRIVHLMLLQSQRPMKLKAMSMITIGVQTMITILKTSFSYFIMIKTFAED